MQVIVLSLVLYDVLNFHTCKYFLISTFLMISSIDTHVTQHHCTIPVCVCPGRLSGGRLCLSSHRRRLALQLPTGTDPMSALG